MKPNCCLLVCLFYAVKVWSWKTPWSSWMDLRKSWFHLTFSWVQRPGTFSGSALSPKRYKNTPLCKEEKVQRSSSARQDCSVSSPNIWQKKTLPSILCMFVLISFWTWPLDRLLRRGSSSAAGLNSWIFSLQPHLQRLEGTLTRAEHVLQNHWGEDVRDQNLSRWKAAQ